MKKRNLESLSPPFPDSKKLNHSTGGVESPKRVGLKKLKQNLKQGNPNWSLKQNAGGPITKDEEEVVETLYALAGMFPNIEHAGNNKLDTSPSALPEAVDRHPPKLEDSVAIEEDLNEICESRSDEAVNPASDIEKSTGETAKVYSMIGPSIQEPCNLSSSEKHHGENSFVAQVNLHKLVKHEEQKTPCNLFNPCFLPGPRQDTGELKQPAKPETSLIDGKTELALAPTTATGNQLDQYHTIGASKNNSPVLWPGLSSSKSHGVCHGPLSQSCAAKVPAWLGAQPGSFQNVSTGKVFKISTDRGSWKRCAAHVYIGHLIRALQIPRSKESLQRPLNQLRPHEILKQGVLRTINDFNGIRNDLNGITSIGTVVNAPVKNPNDGKNDIFQHLRPHQDRSQSALASQKQGFNFLSLSAGGGGMEPNNSFNGPGNGLEPFAQLQVPYHAQYPTLMPFSMSQTRYTPAYHDSPSTVAQQAQLQLIPHLTGPYCVPHASSKALTKQPQQQQQQLWAAQLGVQYGNTSAAMTQFPSWQNERQESPRLMPYIPPSLPSTSTLEVLGPKYPHITQQQQFTAVTLPQARMKRQDHHIPPVYEETGVGFRAGGGTLPLRLLCSEQL
ncbi:hypothetical protein MANES_05G147800v8 [Manihot esculenta]|nr:hypothetical protein MANES_05G147800v8 [Manihot esculenta]